MIGLPRMGIPAVTSATPWVEVDCPRAAHSAVRSAVRTEKGV
jgi:hypothetical protein